MLWYSHCSCTAWCPGGAENLLWLHGRWRWRYDPNASTECENTVQYRTSWNRRSAVIVLSVPADETSCGVNGEDELHLTLAHENVARERIIDVVSKRNFIAHIVFSREDLDITSRWIGTVRVTYPRTIRYGFKSRRLEIQLRISFLTYKLKFVFSKLDLAEGFFLVPLHLEGRRWLHSAHPQACSCPLAVWRDKF